MRKASLAFSVLVSCLLSSCEVPTPNAPAEPIGEFPKWGEGFATPTAAPNSLLGMGQAPVAPMAPGTGPGGMLPGNNMGSTGDWTGGDPKVGQPLFTALCARCHGPNGEGSSMPGGGSAPALADAAWQAKVQDREIARTVVLGKAPGMPAFMQQLNKQQLQGIVAFVRTLKH